MSKPGVIGSPVPINISITTTDATPTVAFSLPLDNDTAVSMRAGVICRSTNTAATAEFDARNSFARTAAGTSSRAGGVNGTQDSTANTFGAPRPSVSFGDPSVSNIATFVITGKAATTIRWNIQIVLIRGAG